MTFGENLQNLRKARGLSQDEVAAKLFVSRQTISKWETDKAEPGIENLKTLAELYGVTVDELLRHDAMVLSKSDDEKIYRRAVIVRCAVWFAFFLLSVFLNALNAPWSLRNLFDLGSTFLAFGAGAVAFGLIFRIHAMWITIIVAEWLSVTLLGFFAFGQGGLGMLGLCIALAVGMDFWMKYLLSDEVQGRFQDEEDQ